MVIGGRKEKKGFISGNSIRDTYRKILQRLIKKGYTIPGYFTSYDVEGLIGAIAKSDKKTKLREVYIRVRYGEADYTKEDVKK